MNKSLEELISECLLIPLEEITDSLSYQDIAQWDSLQHIFLMLELEKEYGISIEHDKVEQLDSVLNIKNFLKSRSCYVDQNSNITFQDQPIMSNENETEIKRGLNGVVIDKTKVSHIDGKSGLLLYRGYKIQDLVKFSSFEQVSYLLLNGCLPSSSELESYKSSLIKKRYLSKNQLDLAYRMRHLTPAAALRTIISGSAVDPNKLPNSNGIDLIAKIPTMIAVHHAFRNGRSPLEPNSTLSHSANFLYMLNGKVPTQVDERAFEQDLISHMEHGANASTFAARVATGTRADLYSAVTAAISTFVGELHGGAVEEVLKMMDEIGTPEGVEKYIEDRMEKNLPIMGFGHRVYRVEDPRAQILKGIAEEMARLHDKEDRFLVLNRISSKMESLSRYGLHPNVDYYTGVIYECLEIPFDLSVPIFIASRISGWVAHVLEQLENNILIRPLLRYDGPLNKVYPKQFVSTK